jgi:SWIM zinc finger
MNLDPATPRLALVPGPDRKRTPQLYNYRLSYLNPDPSAVGCILQWEVSGGRLGYQIAIERDEVGNLTPHCTCADSIFRAEEEGRLCKHIRALLDLETSSVEDNRTLLRVGA